MIMHLTKFQLHEYIRNVTEWLWVAAAIFLMGGALYSYILTDILLTIPDSAIYSSLHFL